MKNLLIVTIIMAAFFSCNSNAGSAGKNGYDIKGKLTGAGGKTIFLDKLSLSNATPVDTAIIAADGSFELKGSIAEKALYMLRLSQDKTWLLILDKGSSTFTGDFTNTLAYEIKGAGENVSLSNFIKTISVENGQLAALNQNFMQARNSGASEQDLLSLQNQYAATNSRMQADIRSFADSVSSPTLAAFAGSILGAEENAGYLEVLMKKQAAKEPKNPYVAELTNKISGFTKLADGKLAPDFEMKTPKGETIKLSSLRGKVVLLDFWASWCRPCRGENPNVVAAYEKFKSKGFTVFSISFDDNVQNWVQAIQQDNLSWENHASELKKWNSEVGRLYNINSIPASFLLDKDGKIVARNLRGAALESKLAELLGS